MMWGYYPGWGGMLWMGLGSLFWFVLLGLAIWLLIRWLSGRTPAQPHGMAGMPGTPPAGPSAMEILRQRYARGEIDTPTFEAMRERLEATTANEDRLQRV